MRLDCTTEKYGALYARWLADPGKLLGIAELQPDERVIDLCGGTGIVAKEALRRGAKTAYVVDLNPRRAFADTDDARMLPPLWGRAEEVDQLLRKHVDMLHALPRLDTGEPHGCLGARCRCRHLTLDFDLVVCRQAIGYLDLAKTAYAVSNVLRPGGRFVFNAFRRPKFAFKHYKHNGKHFVEASGYVGRTVMHVQASPSIGVDVTTFRWHTEEDFERALRPYFNIEQVTSERSLYYVCTKSELRRGIIAGSCELCPPHYHGVLHHVSCPRFRGSS